VVRHTSVQNSQVDAHRARAGVSRRNVVIGVAWAAPVIVLATAIPAAAASPLANSATVYSMQAQRIHPYTHLQVSGFQIQATGAYSAAAIDQFTFQVTVAKSLITNATPSVTGGQWQFLSVGGNATHWTFTFTAPTTVLANGGGTAMDFHSVLFTRVPKSSNKGTVSFAATGRTAGATISVAFPGGTSIPWN